MFKASLVPGYIRSRLLPSKLYACHAFCTMRIRNATRLRVVLMCKIRSNTLINSIVSSSTVVVLIAVKRRRTQHYFQRTQHYFQRRQHYSRHYYPQWLLCTTGAGLVLFVYIQYTAHSTWQLMSRCGIWSVRYLEVKILCKNALGPRIVTAFRSIEVVASRRLPMYYKYVIFNLWLQLWPL